MNRFVVPLNSKKKSFINIHLVGGKAANLLKLNQYGFRSAPGFIITTNVFYDFIRQSNQFEFSPLNDHNSGTLEFYQDQFSALQFDIKVEKKINNFYKKLNGLVAVRSSMVGEDQAGASFAGQLDTYLNIRYSELINSIKMCYASLFKPQLKKYISESHTSLKSEKDDSLAMAVIVQQMVQAKYSGIAFTADPICGRREVIIEASTGTGESLVEGITTPDRYIVNAHGKIAQSAPVRKDQPILSQDQILKLANSANQIAHHMGYPQDIEWAWDGTDFIFLQARPISTLAGKNIYSSKLMADMSPGLIKPLQWSTNTLAMSNDVFGRLFTEIIGPDDIDFSQSIRLFHSRVYANVTFFEELFQRIGLPINFFEMIYKDETGRRQRPRITARFFSIFLFRLIPFILRYARIRNQIEAFIEKQNGHLDQFRKSDWTHIGIEEKLKLLKNLMQMHTDAQWNIILTGLNMTIRNTMLKKMIRRHAPSVEPSNLIKGLSGLKGLEPNKELSLLSQQLRQFEADIIRLCVQENNHRIRNHLSASDAGKSLLKNFDAFMEKFGHLSANTTNFTEVPWIENPTMIWSLIGKGALQKHKTENGNHATFREAKKREVLHELNFMQKPVFHHLLNSTIVYLNLREKISLLLSEDTYQFRRLVLRLGENLVEKEYLNQADDIFYLFFNELESLIHSNPSIKEIRVKIQNRRNQLNEDAKIMPEDTICGNQTIIRRQMKINNSEFFSGICGSAGFKQGYAYVVENPAKISKELTENDILVVPFTHIGWTPLFSMIGGIVAETGGQLSHTSIVAREYGIPAIVGVRRVMQSIKTGQPLTIDADNGRIYLKHIDSIKGDGS